MSPPNDVPSKGFWKGLARVLHLPHTASSSKDVAPVVPTAAMLARPVVPTPVSKPAVVAKSTPVPRSAVKASAPAPVLWKEDPPTPNKMGEVPIVTDYDRIFELVKRRQSMKLDEIARVLAMKEEMVAQELQTLEDNGLVEVKYPAFGEPLIVYKKPEA